MQKFLKTLFLLFCFVFVGHLVGCNNEPILEVTEEIEMHIGEEKRLNVNLTFSKNVTIKYESNNKDIVTVNSDGVVKGLADGSAYIYVSVEGYKVKKAVKVEVKPLELNISGPNTVYIGQTIKLTVTDEKGGQNVMFSSANDGIARVDDSGNVLGIAVGTTNIIVVSSITGEVKMHNIEVLRPSLESLEIKKEVEGKTLVLDEVKLEVISHPTGASTLVTWKSLDETIAKVDEEGLVKTYRSGRVEIIATSKENPEISAKYTLVVEVDPVALISKFHIASPIYTRAKSALIPEMNDEIISSVNLYWFGELNLSERLIPIDTKLIGTNDDNEFIGRVANKTIVTNLEYKTRRPGVIKPAIKYITFHDTGNYASGATAAMHATYIFNSERQRSWHYTVDEKEVIQHVPDNEVAYHGDAYESYAFSIGIETAINKGSDFFTTWHRAAKFIIKQLNSNQLCLQKNSFQTKFSFHLTNPPS